MSDELEIIGKLEGWRKEGADCRDKPGSRCPYHGGTLAHYVHAEGWLRRDLQLALAKADPRYGDSQIRLGNVPAALADARPRIHLWSNAQGFFWSHGATGVRFYEPTVARAVDVDAATGCSDDQTFADVPTESLRAALSGASEVVESEGAKLRNALQEIYDLSGEINPSNYSHDDVCALNDAFVSAVLIADPALSTPPRLDGEREDGEV
ncbi:hypothetical protein D3Y57_06915 [Sphingomonas paeninsulae]|uniref:Uncharacterized protein n=2 Tax=Sphingomonas paeninsulae TaxID=2319844 RepID=A0A494TJZ8_SPHPE|nr:hypothetical protein D3Y57_06915 [Sphingomonas paeninsulae]